MAFLGIKTPCLVPCLPPVAFGCRDKETGKYPCQTAWNKRKSDKLEASVQKRLIEEESDVAKELGQAYADNLDAASTGDSNRSSGAEEIGAFGSVLGEVTGAIAQFGVLGGILGGDGGAQNSADTPLGSFQLTNTVLVFGGIGLGLLLLSQRK